MGWEDETWRDIKDPTVHVITTLPPKPRKLFWKATNSYLRQFWYAVFLMVIGVLIGHYLWGLH
jgi:hypothetical protein